MHSVLQRRAGSTVCMFLVAVMLGACILPAFHTHAAAGNPDTCAICRLAHETRYIPTGDGTAVAISWTLLAHVEPGDQVVFWWAAAIRPDPRGPPALHLS